MYNRLVPSLTWKRGSEAGAPWARKIKKVQKPPGEKGQTIRKSKMLLGPQINILLSKHSSFFNLTSSRVQYV